MMFQQLTELNQNQLSSHRPAVVSMSRFIVTFLLFGTFSDPVGSMLVLVTMHKTQNYMRFDSKLTNITCEIHDTDQTGSILYLSLGFTK